MQHLHSSALTALALATAQMLAAGSAAATPITARFATFNASLNRTASAELLSDLANPSATGANITAANRIQQAHNVAEIIQRIRADVLLINEFDFDLSGTPTASSTAMPLGYSSQAAALFQQNFLSAAHGNAVRGTSNAVNYAYRYTPNTNTGIASGFDLNNNGSTVTTPGAAGYGDDAFGFGTFAGQFGFTVYSKFEIVRVRSFQNFKWKDMPGNLLTNDPTANKLNDFYSAAEVDALRLSSKNHVDVTLRINGQDVHFLTAHPTPPTFDGAEDRNGKRNHDEIRLWADYIAGGSQAAYLYDDQGGTGGLAAGAKFVIAGDYNADPLDGDSFRGLVNGVNYNAINQLLANPLVNTTRTPEGPGGVGAAADGGANLTHIGNPAQDTADFADVAPGNLRVDYVLASANLETTDAGIFWPADPDRRAPNTTGDLFDLVGTFGDVGLFGGFPSSDHRAVWVDVQVNAVPANAVPVPGTLALAALGLLLMTGKVRRRG